MKTLGATFFIALMLSGCYIAIPDGKGDGYSHLVGNAYRTKSDLYIYNNPGSREAYKEKPFGIGWEILPAGTEVTVLSTYTRRFESGITHYAKCIKVNEQDSPYIGISLSNNGAGEYSASYVDSIIERVN